MFSSRSLLFIPLFLLAGCPSNYIENPEDASRGSILGPAFDPFSVDSDADGVSDGAEADVGSNPSSRDTDGDGRSDGEELSAETNPLVSDTDGDGITDGQESLSGTNPLDVDSDDDGLTDSQESTGRTNPLDRDTDQDGLPDGQEAAAGSNPLSVDSDSDGIRDGDETALGGNLNDSDTDDDGIYDGEEVRLGTNLAVADSDGDGIFDGIEVAGELNPLLFDEVGLLVTSYSAEAISISSTLGVSVWFNELVPNYFLWAAGDVVVLRRDPRTPSVAVIVNLDLATASTGIEYGGLVDSGVITDAAVNLSWVAVDGIIWDLNIFDADEVYDWYFGDSVLITHNPRDGLTRMINLTRGQAVLLAP